MIVASVLFLAVAVATFLVGVFSSGLSMIYVSIGASLAAALSLLTGVVKDRRKAPVYAGPSTADVMTYTPAEVPEAAPEFPALEEPAALARPEEAWPEPAAEPAYEPATFEPEPVNATPLYVPAEAEPAEITELKPAAPRRATGTRARKPAAKATAKKTAKPRAKAGAKSTAKTAAKRAKAGAKIAAKSAKTAKSAKKTAKPAAKGSTRKPAARRTAKTSRPVASREGPTTRTEGPGASL